MKRKKTNIIFLALFQLMVFVIPLALKFDHHHKRLTSNVERSITDKQLSKTPKPCPICGFDFLLFIKPIPGQNACIFLAKHVKGLEPVSCENVIPFAQFSTRAPPLS